MVTMFFCTTTAIFRAKAVQLHCIDAPVGSLIIQNGGASDFGMWYQSLKKRKATVGVSKKRITSTIKIACNAGYFAFVTLKIGGAFMILE